MGNTSNLESWAARERLRGIEHLAYWRGSLRREEVAKVFGVSLQQCSADLQRYQELNPGALVYSLNRKRYETSATMRCVLQEPCLEEAMGSFLGGTGARPALRAGLTGTEAEGRVSRVALPLRQASLVVQRRIFMAVLNGCRIRIDYLSLMREETSRRWIRPYAFGEDGYRWHVRAWCEERGDFRDFVLSRIKAAEIPGEAVPLPQRNTDWETIETLNLVPNPDLQPAQQAAVAEDFGLQQGKISLSVRKALLPYTLDHLRLPNGFNDGRPFLVRESADG